MGKLVWQIIETENSNIYKKTTALRQTVKKTSFGNQGNVCEV